MPQKNISEMRAWTQFTGLLILCLIVFFVVAHFIGPRLVRLSDLVPTQTLRAQIHLLQEAQTQEAQTQEAQTAQSNALSSNSADVIILGDSTASRSLAAERIERKISQPFSSKSALSLAVAYGTLANSYTLLLRHIAHHPLPRCIVVMTSYGAARQHYGETFWSQMVDPNLFSYDELLELYEWSRTAGDFPSTAYGLNEYRLKVAERILLNGFSLYLLRNAIFNSRSSEKSARFFNRAISGNGSFSFPRNYQFHANPEFHAYLKKEYRTEPLIDLILKKIADLKTHVLILSTPMAEDFNSPDVQRWTKSHEAHMFELLSTRDNVLFSLKPRTLPSLYFIDPTHLIADGAEKLEDSYVADIQRCLSL